jgi:IclR family acetate operon transcriptional repressor
MRIRAAHVQKLKTVDKALRLLKFLVRSGREMGVGELAAELGTNPASAYRLLRALEEHEFVRRNAATARYQAGFGILELGEALLETLDLRAVARPHLELLSSKTAETAHLMVLDGTMGVYLDRVESPQRVRVASNIGHREHLHGSAVGKAILAYLPEEQIETIIAGAGLPLITRRTITDPAELRTELARIRARGYTIDNMEGEDGVRCVGAPVLDRHGGVIGAVSIAAPANRMPLTALHKAAGLVIGAADRISDALGHQRGASNGDTLRGRTAAPAKAGRP